MTESTEQQWKKEFDEKFVDKIQVSEDEFDVGFKGNVQDLYNFIKEVVVLERQKMQSQLRKEIEGAIGEDESEKTSMHPTAASLRKAELRNKVRSELRTKLLNLLQETK